MKRVLAVFGTRPEAIKMAPIVRLLRRTPGVDCHCCVTGQHRDTLVGILDLFGIAADATLDVMAPGQSLAALTSKLFAQFDPVVESYRPDWILAQGDTTTVMAAALVAFYRRVKFGHVEAGLRTHDRYSPFPEEINRRIADLVADAYFAPTAASRANLLAEGVSDESISVTGNTVIDALLYAAEQPFDWKSSPLATYEKDTRTVLVTVHRRENFGRPLEDILRALVELAKTRPDVRFVLPVHPNPGVKGVVHDRLGEIPNVALLEPLDYHSLVTVMARSTLILTDSGGIQEEAPSLKVPVLVLRESTERPEGVETGAVRLVGSNAARILAEANRLLDDPAARAAMTQNPSPYGDGRASERIVDWIRAR